VRALFLLSGLLLQSGVACAQRDMENSPPLPKLTGVRYVVKRRVSHDTKGLMPKPASDTDAVYIIGRSGMVDTAVQFKDGVRATIQTYRYDGRNRLVEHWRWEHRNRFKRYGPLEMDSIVQSHGMLWEYRTPRVVHRKRYCCGAAPGLGEEMTFYLDSKDQIEAAVSKHHEVPDGLNWSYAPDDSVVYTRRGDTVTRTDYRAGAAPGQATFLYKTDHRGKPLRVYQHSPDGAHFEEETYAYNAAGQLTEVRITSDRASVQPNGIVLRADRITHAYDARGRRLRSGYYAQGELCWEEFYSYVAR